ncbi:hypothetical protein SAMN05444159_4916 [Bradyrhizobium lablabi]|uniref:Uncharacterized protein n=2 Tax=Bradyrhizobium lablabi TaxID=722472 RepID=A0A1M6XMX1_9BRAD|nr:hypothetical protein [Bradyrhizobium lablabi]SHL07256.1 hypothetical protein SAMN05444159_4916 [Bradyrhizobium lablabi]
MVLRWIFRSAVLVAIAALAFDLASLNGWIIYPDPAAVPAEIREDLPALNLPRLVPSILAPLLPGDKRLAPLPQPEGTLAQPMTFELVGGGRLMATGTITPGISKNFATEAERHSEYIRTVVLNSPGGSVTDALAMGRLIREKRFATEVEAGKYCMSSCPLVFAGGVDRRVGDKAAIGVHQVAAIRSAANDPPRDEMSIAQNISARCQHYLADMGVSLQVWVHAMETPHDKLVVFNPEELKSLNIVTAAAAAPTAAGHPTAKTLPGRPGDAGTITR